MSKLSHVDETGAARMVDVSQKAITERHASAQAVVVLSPKTLTMIIAGQMPKGDVIAVARVAGIMAAKKTHDLIPLCHPLPITGVEIRFEPVETSGTLRIIANVKVIGVTGVEMEALTAATISALTIYDMVKAVERGAVIRDIMLLEKTGGASGHYVSGTEYPKTRAQRTTATAPSIKSNRPKPRPLISETRSAPTPPPNDARREIFRKFMVERRMKAQGWAKDAGLASSVIYSYLHGRIRRLTDDQEIALARAANSNVRDVFGG